MELFWLKRMKMTFGWNINSGTFLVKENENDIWLEYQQWNFFGKREEKQMQF